MGDLNTSDTESKEYCFGILEKLYQSRRLTGDVHLLPSNAINGNDILPAHKTILVAGCPYFQDLFFPEIKTEPEVVEDDPIKPISQTLPLKSNPNLSILPIPIEKIILEIILKGIYLDKYVITLDRWERLVEASKLLKLDNLTQECHFFLYSQKIKNETWFLHFRLAQEHEELFERIYGFLRKISPEIHDLNRFVDLKFSEFKMLVEARVFSNPIDLQKAKLKWFAHDTDLRTLHMDDLLLLELPKVEPSGKGLILPPKLERSHVQVPPGRQPPQPSEKKVRAPRKIRYDVRRLLRRHAPDLEDHENDVEAIPSESDSDSDVSSPSSTLSSSESSESDWELDRSCGSKSLDLPLNFIPIIVLKSNENLPEDLPNPEIQQQEKPPSNQFTKRSRTKSGSSTNSSIIYDDHDKVLAKKRSKLKEKTQKKHPKFKGAVKRSEKYSEEMDTRILKTSDSIFQGYMRKGIREVLKSRIIGNSSVSYKKWPGNKPQAIAARIVNELCKYCGNVSNLKCKSQYRSIHFNLKQDKNPLWEMVMDSMITPKALAQMELRCTQTYTPLKSPN